MVEIIEILFSPLLIAFFGYCLYLGLKITKKMYGGRFTTVLPPLLGATTLLLGIQVLHFAFNFSPIHETDFFLILTQMLQLGAGLLLIKAVYSLYQIGFATTGFFGGK